jgi:hypothetical protein
LQSGWLDSTPFSNYLIPGIVLFLFVGLGNLSCLVILLWRKKLAFRLSFFFGLILIIWILAQVAMLGYLSYLQPLYFVSGLIVAALGLYLLKKDKTTEITEHSTSV